MIPAVMGKGYYPEGVPRVGGGDPFAKLDKLKDKLCSPRRRG